VIARDARVEKPADGFAFTEGPTGNANGDVFFTDQPHDRILKWSAEEGLSTSCLRTAGN
jgi:gluconolactonase